MIFESLNAAARTGELILLDGALCHFHLRRDGQLTICEIIVLPEYQRRGIGREILDALRVTPGATSILAKCPADLDSNDWYRHQGFEHEATETTRTGRTVNVWRLPL